MNRNNFFKKALVFAIILSFFNINFTSCTNAVICNDIYEKKSISDQTSYVVLNTLNSVTGDDTASLTFYTFDKTGRKQNYVELSSDIAIEIKNMFDELRYKIIYEPNSIETLELKNSFINLLDENGLLSEKQSKDKVFSLLDPTWLKLINKNNNFKGCELSPNSSKRRFSNSYFIFNVFCTITSAGSGKMMPLFMLPRPRAVAFWFASDAVTSVANLFTGIGFFASGIQSGLLLGFMGIGLTYAIPGVTLYGFIGYSIFMSGFADYIYW